METLVAKDDVESRPQVVVERPMVRQPPEGWPAEHDEASARAPEALQLADRDLVIFPDPIILAIVFQERYDLAPGPDGRFELAPDPPGSSCHRPGSDWRCPGP